MATLILSLILIALHSLAQPDVVLLPKAIKLLFWRRGGLVESPLKPYSTYQSTMVANHIDRKDFECAAYRETIAKLRKQKSDLERKQHRRRTVDEQVFPPGMVANGVLEISRKASSIPHSWGGTVFGNKVSA